MHKAFCRLFTLAACVMLLTVTGCHYDYGHYSVSYIYDCSPRYHSGYCDDSYSISYRVPYDGVRFRAEYSHGNRYDRRGHCD